MAFYEIKTTMEHVTHIGFGNDEGFVIINKEFIVPIKKNRTTEPAFEFTETPLVEWDYFVEDRYVTTFHVSAFYTTGFNVFSKSGKWWCEASGNILPYGYLDVQTFDEYINDDGLKISYTSPGEYIYIDEGRQIFSFPYTDLSAKEAKTTQYPEGKKGKIVKRIANEVWKRDRDDKCFYRMIDFDTVDKQDWKIVGITSLYFDYKNKPHSLTTSNISKNFINKIPFNDNIAKTKKIILADDTFTFFVDNNKKATLVCIKEGNIKTWKGEMPSGKTLDSFTLELINDDGVEYPEEPKIITVNFFVSFTEQATAPQRFFVAPYLSQIINR